MIPILYEETEMEFDSNGIGRLSDCLSYEVTEERNGVYELELVYPVSGKHSESIDLGCIILAKANAKDSRSQPFEIQNVVKDTENTISVFATHISYRMSYIPVKPITNTASITASEAINLINNNAVGNKNFTLKTDKADRAVFNMPVPLSMKAMLYGEEGSLLDCYGGTWHFDHFTATLKGQRGENTDLVIRYGKDLEKLTYGASREDIYTGVLPYWKGSYTPEGSDDAIDVVVVPDLPVVIQSYENKLPYSRNIVVDITSSFQSEEFENYPTKQQVTEKGLEYVKEHITGIEDTTIEVSFSSGNELDRWSKNLGLCDEVTVIHNPFGLHATGKIVKTVYDGLLERYKTIEIGMLKANIVDFIGGNK